MLKASDEALVNRRDREKSFLLVCGDKGTLLSLPQHGLPEFQHVGRYKGTLWGLKGSTLRL